MPVIQIDDTGTKFYYYDSGPPVLTDLPYTTLVILHGYAFNSYLFHRLTPIASASHIRLVLINRRGYGGSTPLADSETNPTFTDDPENPGVSRSERRKLDFYTAFLQVRAAELARFLVKYIENESIPLKIESPGRASGGMSLMAWSLGNILPVSLLAFANTLDPALTRKLDAYLRKIVLYDPPHHILGYPTPPGSYNPLFDLGLPETRRHLEFAVWISGYYSHSPRLFDSKTPVAELMQGVLEQREANPSKPATINRFTPTDISKGLEKITSGHGDDFMLLGDHRPVHRKVLLKALFGDYNDGSAVAALHNVQVSIIWCTESVWETPYAARSVQADIDSPPIHHYLQRSVKFFPFEGANHYAHYDDPLKAMAMFALAIEH